MSLSHSIQQTRQLIKNAERSAHRATDSVLLLAVTKQKSSTTIEEAYSFGLTHFGENYYQEAVEKILKLRHLDINWHFIGPIQSNKTKGIATNFSWVHSVNRLNIAERLNQYRPESLPPLNICLQVNIIEETSKSGVSSQDVVPLAVAISQLPKLKLRGLMTIPPPQKDPQAQYEVFLKLQNLLISVNKQLGLQMDTLSMGMSEDFVPAIKAGATIVRIGSGLFGERI